MSNKLARELPQKTSIWQRAEQGLSLVLDILISIYMLLIIVVMPFYNEDGYSHIGTDKATFFRKVGSYSWKIVLPVFALLVIVRVVVYVTDSNTELTGSKSTVRKHASQAVKQETSQQSQAKGKHLWDWLHSHATECFAAVYGISLLLSYACTEYKDQALRGANGWYMGLLPQLLLLGSFFFIAFFWKPKKWLAGLFLPVSAVVFVLGVLNRFGVYPIDMKVDNWGFISTIGNINWYCGYLVAVFFGGYYLLWQSRTTVENRSEAGTGAGNGKSAGPGNNTAQGRRAAFGKAALVVYLMIGYASLVTQGSESGLFALAVVCVTTFCLSAKDGNAMRMFWANAVILSLTCTILWVIRILFPGHMTFTDPLGDILIYTPFPAVTLVLSVGILMGISYLLRKNRYSVKTAAILAKIALAGSIACVIAVIGLIAYNTLHPGSIGSLSEIPFFTFNDSWGSSRGVIWTGSLDCFEKQNFLHKLIGVGPDCMSAYLYDSAHADVVAAIKEHYGTLTLTNAHNEWLTILVDTGILGCIGFVGMMVSAMVRFLKQKQSLIAGACGLCLLAYTANNMFSFQQSMNTATIFVVLGIGMAFARKRNP